MDLTFLLAVGPPLLIVAYIIKADRFPEPKGTCFLTFVAGTIIIVPAAILNDKLIPDASYAYLAGFTEETLKFLTIYFYVSRSTNFDEPMDAIVYGTLVSLGFATFENLQYVYYSGGSPDAVAIIRAFTAIPLHACCGIIMGYYFGLYMFKNKDTLNLLKSLFFAIGFHAVYNYFATRNVFLMIVVLIILISFARKLHKILQKEQLLSEK
tara:strand:- start:1132 stop:1761 length:630 start_codon:yes stop_codon:yes gene_type:complete